MAMALGSFASRVVATKVVATNGTGDFTTIQAAIDDLPTGGGAVYIKEGTYTITSAITISSNNIALIGSGKGTVIRTTSDITMISITGNDVLIQNLYFIGAGTGKTANIGIECVSNSVVRIVGCNITLCGASAIVMVFNWWSSILNCFIWDNYQHGIYLERCRDCIVSLNWVYRNDYGDTASYDGIHLAEGLTTCTNNIITSNRSHENDRYEINVADNDVYRTLILGNNCNGTDRVGAINDAGTDTRIDHNVT